MPPFIQDMLLWSRLSAGHFLLMFWWISLAAVVLTALSESFWLEGRRRRLLQHPNDGWRTVWLALQLGVLSPPSRRRIFRQARELVGAGVSPGGVLAYLIAGQALLIWMLVFIVELNGPQPMIGQVVAAVVAAAVVAWGAQRLPASLWQAAREHARRGGAGALGVGGDNPEPARSPLVRALKSVAGQVASLWWPLLFGTLGIGFFLALGQSPGFISLQGSKGPLIQLGNAGVGVLAAYVTGAPMVGNALLAAGLWKAQFVTYAGLAAFYLGTMVMPFALPRYFDLFGFDLGRRILWWLVAGIVVGALAATAWWWGLDWLAGIVGVRDWIETFMHSTIRPNDVPWFHHWFAPGL